MKNTLRTCLCIMLSINLTLSGCMTFSTHTRPSEEGTSEAKVAIYWKNLDGERYHVEGMEIQIVPRSGTSGRMVSAISSAEGPVYFTDMPPGRYWLRLSENGSERLKQKIRLKPGRQTSARVNVTGERLGAGTAKVAGTVVIIIAAAVFLLAIATLEAKLDEGLCDRDDDAFIEVNFKTHSRKKVSKPRSRPSPPPRKPVKIKIGPRPTE